MPGKKRSGFERIFEVRLYPTDRQVSRFNEMLWICGSFWNAALSERLAEYQRYQRFGTRADYIANWPSFESQITQLNRLVEEHAWVREPVYYETLVSVLKQLDNSMKRFVGQKNKGVKVGFPRFKRAGAYNTFTIPPLSRTPGLEASCGPVCHLRSFVLVSMYV